MDRKPLIAFFLGAVLLNTVCAFTCDDIEPKTGRSILAVWEQHHKLSDGRDVITTTEQYRMCKPNERDEYQLTRVVNGQYGRFGLLNCTIIRAGGKAEKCESELIDNYIDGVVIGFPSMQVGDAINVKYQEDIEFPRKGTVWSPEDIYLESVLPIERYKLTIEVPSGMNFTYAATKSQPKVEDLGDRKLYRWEANSIPYYEVEDMMPPYRYALDRVSFTTFGSWDEVEGWFEELFTEVMKTQYVQEKVAEITSADVPDRAKVERIYEWVRDNITYEDYGLTFLSGYKPAELKQILIYESGDCKGQAALLATMLKQAGIKAYPVVLTYRDVENDIPGPFAFFHSIVYVPEVGGGMWLDTTCSFCPAGHIPVGIQGINGLILLDGKRGFTRTMELPPEKAFYVYGSEVSVMGSDGSGNGTVDAVIVGDVPYAISELIKTQGVSSLEASMSEEYDTKLTSKCGDATVKGMKVNINGSVMDQRFDYTCAKVASKSGKKLILETESDLGYGGKSFAAIVAKDKRRFPIYISTAILIDVVANTTLPPCFGIEDYPLAEDVNYSFLTTTSESEIDEGTNSVNAHARVQFYEDEIPVEKFAWFKGIFNKLIEKKSIILYSLDGDIARAQGEANAAIEASEAPGDKKDAWKQKLTAAQNEADTGKCMKAMKTLEGLKAEVKSYRPPQEKKEEPKPEKPAAQPDTTPKAGGGQTLYLIIAAVLVAAGAFILMRRKSNAPPDGHATSP